jgi:hypothetical protein
VPKRGSFSIAQLAPLERAASGACEAVVLVRSASAPVSMPNDSKTV